MLLRPSLKITKMEEAPEMEEFLENANEQYPERHLLVNFKYFTLLSWLCRECKVEWCWKDSMR
jgi:hypothetical protein